MDNTTDGSIAIDLTGETVDLDIQELDAAPALGTWTTASSFSTGSCPVSTAGSSATLGCVS